MKISKILEIQSIAQKGTGKGYPILDVFSWKLSQEKSHTDNEIFSYLENLKKSSRNYGLILSSEEDIRFFDKRPELLGEIVYLPGDFCRQSDILVRAAELGCYLIIEKAPFLPPPDVQKILNKLHPFDKVAFVECGGSFGYSNSVLDLRSLVYFQKTKQPFGINLSELLHFSEPEYTHKPDWLTQSLDFVKPMIEVSFHLGGSFIVWDARDSKMTELHLKIMQKCCHSHESIVV